MKTAGIFVFFLLVTMAAWPIPFFGVDTGLLFIINTEAAGAPNPVILQGLGITLPFVVSEGFYMDSGLLLYGCQYQYLNNRAIPADNERADTIWVLFAQIDVRVGFNVSLSKDVAFGACLGPALVFPFPLFAYDNGEQYREPMFAFFYNNLKFLYAEVELFLRWAIVSDINLTFKARALYPLAAIWDDLSISRWNGLMLQAMISLEIPL